MALFLVLVMGDCTVWQSPATGIRFSQSLSRGVSVSMGIAICQVIGFWHVHVLRAQALRIIQIQGAERANRLHGSQPKQLEAFGTLRTAKNLDSAARSGAGTKWECLC